MGERKTAQEFLAGNLDGKKTAWKNYMCLEV
jgi:hypothetical protein